MFHLILNLCALSVIALGASFPSNQQKCYIGDTNCIVRVANEVIVRARYGYPQLGLPVIEPLRVGVLNVQQGGDGPVSLKISMKNVDIIGLSQIQFRRIEGFRPNVEKLKIELQFYHPIMQIVGPYKLDGKVLILPVQGNGRANISLNGVDANMKILAKQVFKQGRNYLQIEKTKLSFEIEKAHVNFENLFNGNKQLGDSTNFFFNENWQDILKELKPALGQSFSQVYATLINSVFSNIPFDEMFLT